MDRRARHGVREAVLRGAALQEPEEVELCHRQRQEVVRGLDDGPDDQSPAARIL